MRYEVRPGRVCGIYKITNLIDGKVYVGKSKNIRSRYRQYERDFEKQAAYHMNLYLLRAMNKYGGDNFSMSVLEECVFEDLPVREFFWMRELDSLSPAGYNLRSDTTTGMVTHPDTSEKISQRLKAEWDAGVREGHSGKLKASWEGRDREFQSGVMKKALTRYYYLVDKELKLDYQGLVAEGLGNSLSTFYSKKSDSITFKGRIVERFKITP